MPLKSEHLKRNLAFSCDLTNFYSTLPQKDCLVGVPTSEVQNEAQLDEIYATYIGDGYEGQIVRTNSPL